VLAGSERAAMIAADLREPAEVLAARPLRALVNMAQPVAYLLIGALRAVPDDRYAGDLLTGYAAAAAPDSHIVVAHTGRGPAELMELLGDLTLVEPGIVPPPQWRPDGPAATDPGATAAAARDRKSTRLNSSHVASSYAVFCL